MILILSREDFEVDTEHVIDWLDSLGGNWVRLNAEDLAGRRPYEISFDLAGCIAAFRVGQREAQSDEAQAIWFRKWHRPRDFSGLGIEDSTLRFTVEHHLMREMRMLSEAIFHSLDGANWLTAPRETRLSKLRALQLASMAGLNVPDTLITNFRSSLKNFKDRHRRIITKSIGDLEVFEHAGRNWTLYTREITQDDLDAAPQSFFPTLVQERLEKDYEIRSFYLDGQFYSMAIFSQDDPRTKEDFRHYNCTHPNRCVPYRLPSETAMALQRFMDSAELTTGSVDLIHTPEGNIFFLEVNPGGQFGMVSQPCNYFLEKKVATHLMSLDAGSRQTKSNHSPEILETEIATKKTKTRNASDTCNQPEVDGEPQISALFRDEDYPLGYRLMNAMDDSGDYKLHISESSFHRSAVYASHPYHKAISRPFSFELAAGHALEAPIHG